MGDSIKRVKLADFGMSKMVHNKKQKADASRAKLMQTNVGTLSYQAPEILRGKGYDRTVDFWSIGVIMFILLCGYPPFYGETDYEISQSILKEDVDFEDEDWEHVNDEVKSVVSGLLRKDPSKRLTTDSVLQLTFKMTGKNMSRGWKKSRVKFKQHIVKRKVALKSMTMDAVNSKMRSSTHRVGLSQDDHSQYRNSQKMSSSNRQYKAMGGRRGSKTAEQFQINLPMTQRTSLVANFMTDDDIRKKKLKEKEESENRKYEDAQYTVEMEAIDEDDQKESQ